MASYTEKLSFWRSWKIGKPSTNSPQEKNSHANPSRYLVSTNDLLNGLLSMIRYFFYISTLQDWHLLLVSECNGQPGAPWPPAFRWEGSRGWWYTPSYENIWDDYTKLRNRTPKTDWGIKGMRPSNFHTFSALKNASHLRTPQEEFHSQVIFGLVGISRGTWLSLHTLWQPTWKETYKWMRSSSHFGILKDLTAEKILQRCFSRSWSHSVSWTRSVVIEIYSTLFYWLFYWLDRYHYARQRIKLCHNDGRISTTFEKTGN